MKSFCNGLKITELRKQHNLSQTELAKKLNASRTIVGNYERNENTPSIDMVLKRIEDIEQLDNDTQNKLFFLIDNIVQNFKTKQAFAK